MLNTKTQLFYVVKEHVSILSMTSGCVPKFSGPEDSGPAGSWATRRVGVSGRKPSTSTKDRIRRLKMRLGFLIQK